MTISRANSFQRDQWRLSTAMVISAIVHALLLSITLGGQTFGLPALKFPWLDRRLGANELQVLLMPRASTLPASTPPPEPNAAQTVNANPVLAPVERPTAASPAASMTSPPPAIGNSEAPTVLIPPPPAPAPAPVAAPDTKTEKRPEIPTPVTPVTAPVNAPANSTVRNIPIQEREAPVPDNAGDIAQKQIEKDTREHALEEAKLEQEKQAAERLRQAELMADAQRQAARQEQQRQEAARLEQERADVARKEALRQELAKQAQLEAARQDQLRQEAVRAEQARNEAARQETERLAQARQDELRREQARLEEKARQDTARQAQERAETARLEAARKEALRQDQAKQAQLEAARQAQQLEAARQDAIKQEASRQEAAKQEAARMEQAKREQAQLEKAKQEAEREERLKAIGRQLNEEAAQREAASKKSLLPSASGLRRGWLFGRADPNIDLVQYAEAMSKKFELNMAFDLVRDVVKQRHVPPMVTVAIRADGSVEKVTFVVSSGVPAIDEAIRKVVMTYAPYGAFPPAVARQYDVIEIRRTWIFDTAIRLQ